MVDHFRAFLLSQIISHEVVIKVPVNKTPVDHLQGFCSKIKRPGLYETCNRTCKKRRRMDES